MQVKCFIWARAPKRIPFESLCFTGGLCAFESNLVQNGNSNKIAHKPPVKHKDSNGIRLEALLWALVSYRKYNKKGRSLERLPLAILNETE
jgi:hypothetical protein